MMNNITKAVFTAIVFSSVFVSCSEDAMDKVNKDINHTTNVQAKFILADVITSTAFNNIGGDLSTYTSIYVEHEVGVYNQTFNAEKRNNEPSASSTFNNVWGSAYTALKNSRIIIDKCSAGGTQPSDVVTRGVAEVMAAINSALIADMFGDAPWSEAALIDAFGLPKYMNPKVDSQKDIYAGVMKYLDAAIVDLQGTNSANGNLGSYDFIYGGNKESWLKLAYGLKARYTMRLIARSANKQADLQAVIDNVDKSFASASEQAQFAIYDAANLNPLFDFQWSRGGLAASESMSEKLKERNDPRLSRAFVYEDKVGVHQITGDSDPKFLMAPNGANEEKQGFYNASVFTYSQTAPTMLQSYHELLFLKAEALCRLAKTTEAEPVLKAAVVAAIANAEVSIAASVNAPALDGSFQQTTAKIDATAAAAYFENQVKALFLAAPLQEVMIQKYLACFGASGESLEAYNDYRRMKALNENFIVLKNAANTTKFPLRCPYGSDDTLNNPNVQAVYGNGQYVYNTPVWWALGTR